MKKRSFVISAVMFLVLLMIWAVPAPADEPIEIIWRDAVPPEVSPWCDFGSFEPGVTIVDSDGVPSPDGDIIYERDVAVEMRDGTIIYTDIYRPVGATNVPAIVAWSPYGKRANYVIPRPPIPGVPPGTVSPMAKTEGPDPSWWCRQGYAIINPDARGTCNSEGNIYVFGPGEGQDAYDLIEWVAAQGWSNGKVGMSGNSWLAVSQWFTAALKPPHLAAIAPWDGFTDVYRNLGERGGIPEVGFNNLVVSSLSGRGLVEDLVAMALQYPLINSYWETKIAPLEEIDIPAYMDVGWTNTLHIPGTIEGFRKISSPNKWLVAHREFEWEWYYTPENMEDLRLFFDRYLKGINNGWEMTPRVGPNVMDYGDVNYVRGRPEKDFPLPRTEYDALFLDAATGTLSPKPVKKESSVSYEATEGMATFVMRFDEDTELTGYLNLRLWVEADGSDDMDLFVAVHKLDEDGNLLPILSTALGQQAPAPIGGPWGWQRVSKRQLDEVESTPWEPVHTFRVEELLNRGEIVPVEIEIMPTSRFWYAGEQLRVVVAGGVVLPWPFAAIFQWDLRNQGTHIIHTGGRFDSHLLVPRILSEPEMVNPSSHDFGWVVAGSDSTPQVFTLLNQGYQDLGIDEISLTGRNSSEFMVQKDTCSGESLAPDGYCTFQVVFSPESPGAKRAALSILSDNPTFVVPLAGGTGQKKTKKQKKG